MPTRISDALSESDASFQINGTLNTSGSNVGIGGAISSIGDFNGDGTDDLLVSAGGLDGGTDGSPRTDVGGAFIIFGGSDLASDVADGQFDLTMSSSDLAGNGFYVLGAQTDDLLTGTAAGDVNGDGFDDVLLTAPSFVEIEGPGDPTYDHRPGTAYILYGGPSAEALTVGNPGLIDLASLPAMSDGAPAVTVIHGEPEFLRAGLSATGGGDLNGDGLDDIALGTFQADGLFYNPDGSLFTLPPIPGLPSPASAFGRVYALYGGANMPAEIHLKGDIVEGDGSQGFFTRGFAETRSSLEGPVPEFFGTIGFSITLSMADLDGDGRAELLLGTPFGGELKEGSDEELYAPGGVFLMHFDGTATPGAEVDLRDHVFLEGETTGELTLAGLSTSVLGDINNDGIVDIGLNAPMLDAMPSGGGNLTNAGAVYVLLGGSDLFAGGLPSRGTLLGDGSFRLLGQAEGDAADVAFDLLEDDAVDGLTGGLFSGLTALGDINGDGIDDFAAGFSNANGGAGSVFVVLGRNETTSAELTAFGDLGSFSETPDMAGMERLDGEANDSAGFSLAGAIDLNGDGTPELLIGAPGPLEEMSGTDGIVYVLSTGDETSGPAPLTLTGTPDADRLVGAEGNDTIRGLDGADTLNGGAGDDLIEGGATDADLRDVIFAGAGNDSVDAGAGNDQVFGQDGNDTIAGGAGVDDLQGQDGDDVITGSNFSDLVFGGAGNDFVNGGFGSDRINGGTGADKFFHAGVEGHGSDWVQDYVAADGDVLLWGGVAATADDFQVNFAHTANDAGERSGDDAVQEAFVIYKPTEQIMWALVDGNGQSAINIQIGGDTFDLLA